VVAGGTDDQVEDQLILFAMGGVDDPLIVLRQPYAHRPEGSREVDAADGERRGGADHAEDVDLALLVRAERGGDDLHVTAHAVGEERPETTIGKPACEDGALGRASLTAEEAARNLARRVEPLFVVHGEGEEVDARSGRIGCTSRYQTHCVARAHHHGAVGLDRQFPSLNAEDAIP